MRKSWTRFKRVESVGMFDCIPPAHETFSPKYETQSLLSVELGDANLLRKKKKYFNA